MNPTETMSSPRSCPVCGTPLLADTPEGLCPACLLKAGLATQAPPPADSPTLQPPGSSPTKGPKSPSVAEVAQLFPQLEILELLGAGGMGAVYKARQPQLDRFVALKLMRAELSRDPAFAERFAREARALAKLNHPNIVSVFDSGQSGGFCHITMEFVDGTNLRSVMRAGKMTPREALGIVPKICDALQFAHDEGIVHRDIKPENILLDTRGRVKIADFGLAKLVGKDAADFSLTATGMTLGTPRYMAPEQFDKPQEVDHRADIYSLGITLFYLLTATRPFDGQTAYAIILAHANNALPRPADIGVPLPANVEALIRRMTAKLPVNRYPDYASLLADIRRVKAGQPIAGIASADAETIVSATAFEPPPGAAEPAAACAPDPSPAVAEAGRGRRWLLLPATIVFAAVAIVVALVFTKHPPAKTAGATGDDKGSNSVAQPNEPPTGDDGFRGPPPPKDGKGYGGKGKKGPPSPLAPIEDIVNPLADGPAAELWEQAKTFAAANTNDFRAMFARFEQVQQKARGTALERQIAPVIDQWTLRRNAALEKSFAEFNALMAGQEKSLGPHAVSVWREFPDELRSREVDQRIYDIVLKTVDRITGGGGGTGGPPPEEFLKRGPSPDGEPGPKGPKGGPDGDKKGGKGPPDFEPKGKRRPDDPGGKSPPP